MEQDRRLYFRAAMTLLMMMLTTVTAWAEHFEYSSDGYVKVNINGEGTVTLTNGGTEVVVTSGTTYAVSDQYTLKFLPSSDNVVNNVTKKEVSGTTDITNDLSNIDGGKSYSTLPLGPFSTDVYTVTFGPLSSDDPISSDDPLPQNSYRVHFDGNGGILVSGSMADQLFTIDEEQALTKNAFNHSALDYSFSGWNTKPNGLGVSYTDGQKVTNIAADGETITLYAQWHDINEDVIIIQFFANGGTGYMANQKINKGDAKELTANTFTRIGYRFTGWNTKADGSGYSYTDQEKVFLLGNTKLYAQWTPLPPNSYFVSFNSNSSFSSGSMADQVFTIDEEQALTKNAFNHSLQGYSFSGWNTKADGSGVSYTNGQTVTNIAAVGETITLYAQWKYNSVNPIYLYGSHAVYFDANGGMGYMTSQMTYIIETNKLNANTFTRDGYSFTGWNTKADGSGTAYTDQQNISPENSITLYAQWKLEHDLYVNGDTYTVNTVTGWDNFCNLLAENTKGYFTGKIVKLGNDISVSRMAGSSDKPFTGTFDGNRKTLTVSYENTDNNTRTAPFSYVDGATIQNLIVSGSITGSANRAAGIIGETGTNTSYITNCVSSSTISGGRYTGGFSIGGNVEIEGCVFDGKINGTELSGGFVGYSNSKLKITNCLFAPKSGSSISGGTFYYNGGGDITPTNSYYTEPLGTVQGTKAYAINVASKNLGEAVTDVSYTVMTTYENGVLFGGKYYMAPEAVTLNDNADNDLSGVDGYLADVTLNGRTLYKDGDWNTLVLPFDVTVGSGQMAGATAMTMNTSQSGFDASTGTLTLNFDEVTSGNTIAAGTPFIVKWTGTDVTDPVFTGVTISSTTAGSVTSEGNLVQFKGIYNPTMIYSAANDNLFLGAGNNLYWPSTEDYTLNACRAYFHVDLGGEQHMREIRMNLDGDAVTSIHNSKFIIHNYPLPTKRIVNGRLIIERNGELFNANGSRIVISGQWLVISD